MARIKINLPDQFQFQCTLTVRITDINYGNHVGNDAMLSIIHEARMQYLQHLGYSEMNLEGVGMIMSDAGLEFKSELFYGEQVLISVTAGEFSKIGFDLFYKLEKRKDEKLIAVAFAKTGMICFDYGAKKIAAIPAAALNKLKSPLLTAAGFF